MTETIKIKKSCGCLVRREIRWDGRCKRPTIELYDRGKIIFCTAREQAEILQRRADGDGDEECIACLSRSVTKLAEGLWQPAPIDRHYVRPVTRLLALTGGTLKRSPKSNWSYYVQTRLGTIRLSDHRWPGCPVSLVHERPLRGCGLWMSRLRPGWLAREKAK